LFYDDPNIYRAADLLIWCHGTNANIEAAGSLTRCVALATGTRKLSG